MSVFRVNKTENYTIMSNYHFKETNMSLKAKGLLSLMLSLPDNWDYSIAGLVSICKENETSIKSTLEELKQFGYLEVIKKMPNETKSGRIEYEYLVYEQKQDIEKQGVENLGVEFLGVENQGQLNTNKLSTNKLNTNNKKNEIIFSFDFTDNSIKAIKEWLQYKKEKSQTYKDKGLEILCKKLFQMQKDNGDKFLVNAINHSMANNYAGIYPENKNKQNNTYQKREYTEKDLNSLYSDLDSVEI